MSEYDGLADQDKFRRRTDPLYMFVGMAWLTVIVTLGVLVWYTSGDGLSLLVKPQ